MYSIVSISGGVDILVSLIGNISPELSPVIFNIFLPTILPQQINVFLK